nr:ribosomal protein l14 [Schizosaccharomyces pombe]
MEGFKRYVEVGRVVLVTKGEYTGKLAVIVDIVDHKRALIDSPCSEFPRQVIRYGSVVLTHIVMKLPRGAVPALSPRSGRLKMFATSGPLLLGPRNWKPRRFVAN